MIFPSFLKKHAGVLVCSFFICCSARAQDTASTGVSTARQVQDALYFDATRARVLGEDKQAEGLLKDFVRKYPNEAAPYHDLARLSLKSKSYDKALTYIEKAVTLDKNNPWYQAQYAEILAFEDKYEEAAKVYEKLAKTEQFNEEYLFKAAMFYQQTKKYGEAITVLDKLIAKTGNDEEILLQKQQIYLKLNKLDEAVKVAEALIADNPHDSRFYANLADLYDNSHKPEKAAKILEDAQKQFPDDPVIQLSLAEHYRLKNDFVKYDEYVTKAITNNTLDAETQINLLLPYLQASATDTMKRKTGEALAARLAAQHPHDAQVLAIYGQVLAMNDKLPEAIVQYKESVAIDPASFNVWQQLLYSYTDRQDADSLILYSQKAMRYFPNQAPVHYLNGIGYLNKKDYVKAVKSILRAIDLQPEEDSRQLSGMYSSLGDAFNFLKEYKRSDSAYEQALRLDPLNATVLNNYAYYLSERGDRLDAAERMSKKSLEIRPGEATFLDTYGWILYKQGKYADARKYIEDAIKANPGSDGTLWDHLGDIQYKLNDRQAAVANWRKAKEKGTDNPKIDQKIGDQKLYE